MSRGQGYARQDIQSFGRQLITTGDLDPIYLALTRLWSPASAQLRRWLIAYWCFYDAGVACWLSEHPNPAFWPAMLVAARNSTSTPFNGRWPRGKERRHFRGQACITAAHLLCARYEHNPSAMVDYIAQAAPDFVQVTKRAQEHTLFGPWIGFKIADMINSVLKIPVDFTNAAIFMFKDPQEAALRYWRERLGVPPIAQPKCLEEALNG